jgi:uncharacterized protein
MAETLISPGVLARENDQSFITSQPVTVGAAIIGPTVKGPVEIPTVVTSYSDFTTKFGSTLESGSQTHSYLTSVSVNNYFQNGGESILVTRVVTGSFTSAKSSPVLNNVTADTKNGSFVLETISEGTLMNNLTDEDTYITGGYVSSSYVSGFTETLGGGALISGSSDNVRWEIPTVNTESGTFSLLIRRGDDNHREKVVLETYQNLSLDPNSADYIEAVIGNSSKVLRQDGSDYYIQDSGSFSNKSRYIRVKSVNYPTLDYFDNLGNVKSAFTASLPKLQSGSFYGASGELFHGSAHFNHDIVSGTNIQGLKAADYNTAISLLGNKDEYRFNVITAPGLTAQDASSQVTSLVNLAIARTDCLTVIDLVRYGSTTANVIEKASSQNSSYAAAYWPWGQVVDPGTGKLVWVPASTLIPGVYAFTDASSDSWFAPAGLTRGGLDSVVKVERKLPTSTRDSLYDSNINPLATFPQAGVVVFGQKTLQKKSSALDRINVRRLLISLKSFISQVADQLVFEQNTIATRNSFLSQVNPYLESVQQRQGLFAFKVVMDESNNTADVVDRNELVGQIFLQPTRTAEFILLDFNVLPTGATFPS